MPLARLRRRIGNTQVRPVAGIVRGAPFRCRFDRRRLPASMATQKILPGSELSGEPADPGFDQTLVVLVGQLDQLLMVARVKGDFDIFSQAG